jgi:hypothetical protein
MRGAGEPSYELQVQDRGRWVINAIHPAKSAAVAAATALAGSNRFEAVRVVEEREGRGHGKVVFEQQCEVVEPPMTIAPIATAPLCKKLPEYYGFEARKTLGRLLRPFLNHHGITAFELVHSYDHLRTLERLEELVGQAVHRIASIQGRIAGVDSVTRIDELYKAFADAIKRAEAAADVSPFVSVLKQQGLAPAKAAIENERGARAAPFALNATLAAYLSEGRDWSFKTLLAVELLQKDSSAEAVAFVDECLAEILDGAAALQEVIGSQKSLGLALATLADVGGGRLRIAGERAAASPLGRLVAALARHSLPLVRNALIERVIAGLKGVQPLTREGQQADGKAFAKILAGVTGFGGFYGGPAMSEAVTRRIRMVMNSNGRDLSVEEGIAKIFEFCPTPAVKLGYLLDLSGSEFGTANKVVILKTLYNVLQEITSIRELAPDATHEEFVKAVSEVNERLRAGLFPEDVTALIAKRLAKLAQSGTRTEPKLAEPAAEPAAEAPRAETDSDGIRRKRFSAGAYVFRQGDRGDEAYMVDRGEIAILVGNGKRERIIAVAERGEVFGEMALVDRKPRMASARAKTDSVVIVIPEEEFRARLDRIAEVDRLILGLLTRYVERLRAQSALEPVPG